MLIIAITMILAMAARTTYEPRHTDLDPTLDFGALLDFGLFTPSSFSACRRRGQQEETDESEEEMDESDTVTREY